MGTNCALPSRHISVLIRSGIHTVFAVNWKEKVSISVKRKSAMSIIYIGVLNIHGCGAFSLLFEDVVSHALVVIYNYSMRHFGVIYWQLNKRKRKRSDLSR